jgi:TRAP-type C4-dicarboxylate transport system permease small subunit
MNDRRFAGLTRALSKLGAFWAMALAFLVIADIIGREAFSSPLPGTIEIVGNSVVAILFLQLPHAIAGGAMLRSTIVYDRLGELGRAVVDGLALALGLAFFVALAAGGWDDMIEGWRILEFEGEGALRVPVYPVRTLIVGLGLVAAAVYAALLWRVVRAAAASRAGHG